MRDRFPCWLVSMSLGIAMSLPAAAQGLPPQAVERLKQRLHKDPPASTLEGDLGTKGNPVRVLLPEGEQEYLARLRCENGSQPRFERSGSTGIGPYGTMLDAYSVRCPGGASTVVYMDMYHCDEEDEAIPGFTIVPEIGHRDRTVCD